MLRICHTNLNQINLRKYKAGRYRNIFLKLFSKTLIFRIKLYPQNILKMNYL
jgi:hypothetical protein